MYDPDTTSLVEESFGSSDDLEVMRRVVGKLRA